MSDLREKVAREIAEAYYRDLSDGEYGVSDLGEAKEWFPEADAAIALVLEEAAKAMKPELRSMISRGYAAAAIRALGKESK